MSRCSPLGEAVAITAEVENMEEITVLAELECMFGENPAASDGEGYAASLNAEDDLDKGASDNVKLRPCYFGSSTITVGKIKEMEERGYFSKGEGHAPGAEPCQSQMATKPSYMRTFLSPACACLRIRP
jgi:hypothetical protein